MKKVILSIDGMTCSACSNGLEKYLNKQDGIKSASVNLVMATVSIEYDDNITLDDLNNYVKNAGFTSLGIASLDNEKKKDSLVPFFIFGFLAILIMYISMSHMFHFPITKFLDINTHSKDYSIFLLILVLPFLFYGSDIIKNGIKNLIHRMPNMDTLICIGVLCSFLYSLFGVMMVILGNDEYVHNLYFEGIAFVIFFIKLGRFIDKSAKRKTRDNIKTLVTITPKEAKIKTNDGFKIVTIDEVKKGDILVCFAGEKVAVDGEIINGQSHFDLAFITGESKPVSKGPKDKVIAGSINYDNTIEYKALKIGKESTISEIVNLVVEATNTKAPISLLADKICSYFVPTIIIISILTFVVCMLLGVPFNISLTRFITVLVVACPCALGLATPLAIVVSEGVCAKKGILVKSSEILEVVSKIDTVIFDKTGTLTNGNLSVSKIYNYGDIGDDKLFSILGSIEQYSVHPIAKGIMNYINDNGIKINSDFKAENIDGFGVKATYKKDTYYACNAKLLEKLKIKNHYLDNEKELSDDGCSIVYVVQNKKIIGLVGIKDTLRLESTQVINNLKNMNKDIIMLTGDNEITAKRIGKSLGIDNIIASVVPKEKANIIKKLKKEGKKVIMVGDGINDAPSLTLADIGISLSSGTDVATSSSDVLLINNNLNSITNLIYIGKRTLRNIKQNLFWAFLYNICMIPIAMGLLEPINIKINPMVACISMIFSSLFVIFNALRLRKLLNK